MKGVSEATSVPDEEPVATNGVHPLAIAPTVVSSVPSLANVNVATEPGKLDVIATPELPTKLAAADDPTLEPLPDQATAPAAAQMEPLDKQNPPVPLTAAVRAVGTPVPRPVIPEMGSPVALVSVRLLGMPSAGVTSVGDVANTAFPVPVLVVSAARRFALDGVPRKVDTPVARPETPVLIGSPVAFVRVMLAGVP